MSECWEELALNLAGHFGGVACKDLGFSSLANVFVNLLGMVICIGHESSMEICYWILENSCSSSIIRDLVLVLFYRAFNVKLIYNMSFGSSLRRHYLSAVGLFGWKERGV